VSERHPFIRRPWLVALVAALSMGVLAPGTAVAASGHSAASLGGWLAAGPSFPSRAMVLFPPAGKVARGSVQVTEDGTPVRALTVTPVAQAGAGDFGLVIVLDQGQSMAGGPTAAALSATHSLAGLRRARQQLGVVTFTGKPSVLAPLSSNSAVLSNSLAQSPLIGHGADVAAGVQSALAQLAQSHVALGAVVVVSDGVGLTSGSTSPASVAAAAGAARVPIFTVGLKDRASNAASLSALAQAAPGRFVSTNAAGLRTVFKEIDASVTRGYVARWRSAVNANRTVTVSAHISGVPGTINSTYSVTGLHTQSPSAKTHHAGTAAPSGRLSTSPVFAHSPPASPPVSSPPATRSFWASSAAVPVVAGISALLFALALAFALYRPSQRGVRVRVNSFLPSDDVHFDEDFDLGPSATSKGLARFFEHGRWWPPFVQDVDISRNPRSPGYLVKRAALIAIVLAVLVTVASGSVLLAFLPLLAWPWVLRSQVRRAARKQRDSFRESLPGYLQDLSSAMRVGRSFVGALTVVTESADEPTRSELERAITDEALGRPLDQALEAVAKRMDAVDLDQVALIAALNRRSGSNVAEALDRVAEGARERADLRREVRALTAQAKMSSMVLTGLPGLMLIGVNLISAQYAYPLLHTTIGIALLVVGALMVWGGWKVMSKITEIKV
jgi:tight adherence protein B